MKQTVGQLLRDAREKLNISLDDAARETHIRLNYLQELENDHPEQLHSAAQARGFLRLYAAFLKLPYNDLLALWDNPEDEETNEPEPERKEPRGKFARLKHILPERPKAASAEIQAEGEPVEAPQEEIIAEGIVQVEESDGEGEVKELPKEELTIVEVIAEEDQQAAEEPQQTVEESSESGDNVPSILASISRWLTKINPLKKVLKIKGMKGALTAEEEAKKPIPKTSSDIFREIGDALRSRRMMMELNLSDIENFTNLKRSVLIAIEDGRFNDLPSTVQGRGMLNNYAKFLGMEESAIMDLYGRALQLQREERQGPQRKSAGPPVTVKVNLPERWRKIINLDLLIGGALILGLFTFIIWGASQVFSTTGSSSTEAPSISDVLQLTPSVSPGVDLTQIVETESLAEEATPLPGVAVVENTPTVVATVNPAPLQLVIIARDRAYLKVTVDGVEEFNGRIITDNVYTYSGNESIQLLSGNAYALEAYFNQEYIGSLGNVGDVVNMEFTLEGLNTPTPAPTSTATPTPATEEEDAADLGE